jgi:hypothetical protein
VVESGSSEQVNPVVAALDKYCADLKAALDCPYSCGVRTFCQRPEGYESNADLISFLRRKGYLEDDTDTSGFADDAEEVRGDREYGPDDFEWDVRVSALRRYCGDICGTDDGCDDAILRYCNRTGREDALDDPKAIGVLVRTGYLQPV